MSTRQSLLAIQNLLSELPRIPLNRSPASSCRGTTGIGAAITSTTAGDFLTSGNSLVRCHKQMPNALVVTNTRCATIFSYRSRNSPPVLAVGDYNRSIGEITQIFVHGDAPSYLHWLRWRESARFAGKLQDIRPTVSPDLERFHRFHLFKNGKRSIGIGSASKPEGMSMLSVAGFPFFQDAITIERSADERHMSECLREVVERFTAAAVFLGVETQVIRIAQHAF